MYAIKIFKRDGKIEQKYLSDDQKDEILREIEKLRLYDTLDIQIEKIIGTEDTVMTD